MSGSQELTAVSGRHTHLQLTYGVQKGVPGFKKRVDESEKIQKRLGGGLSGNQFI